VTPEEVAVQLEGIAGDEDFPSRADELTEEWESSGAGIETVEPVLKFIESHPEIDFGNPGPLVHFVERFYGKGYEDRLVDSLRRKPTTLTAWMLNRVINGTRDQSARSNLIEVMSSARNNPAADPQARDMIAHFVDRLSSG
jgi:hypothetical protein